MTYDLLDLPASVGRAERTVFLPTVFTGASCISPSALALILHLTQTINKGRVGYISSIIVVVYNALYIPVANSYVHFVSIHCVRAV